MWFGIAAVWFLVPLAWSQPRRIVPLNEGGRRWALVVGNDDYRSVRKLRNGVNDARGMAAVLRGASFTVAEIENATREAMDAGVTEFVSRLRPGDVALFYYSGHGLEIAGENYLVPVDLSAANEVQARNRSIKANEILEQMEASGAALNIVVLDACRDNPFKGARAIGGSGGLAVMNAGTGTLLAYATAPGKTADDNQLESNGLYTRYLMQALRLPGLPLEQVFKRAGGLVEDASKGAQVPWYSSSVRGEFYFLEGAPGSIPRPALPPPGPSGPKVQVNPRDGVKYVWIAPGTFQMGCSPGDTECWDGEKPVHTVTISKGFWMGQTAVTVGAYQRYVRAAHRTMARGQDDFGRKVNAAAGNDSLPVVLVNWEEAAGYCGWAGMRLPTEAEWEYAARAGGAAARDGDLDEIAWYGDNSGRGRLDSAALWKADPRDYYHRLASNGNGPKPVGQKPPNAWGLYDTLGNVSQWVADWYGEKYYQTSERQDPSGPPGGESRVLRGGGWGSLPDRLRLSFRGWSLPALQPNDAGIRCAANVLPVQ